MEQFRELEEFPGYKIGNRGTILLKSGKPMKQQKKYLTETYCKMVLSLINKDDKRYTKPVHRLVALAWIPNPDNEPEIDHIDRNPTNNCVENLRWTSRMKNANNMGICKTNKSGITGLSYCKSNQRWYVQKNIMGMRYQKAFKERSDAEAYLKELVETPRFIDVDLSTE